MKLENLIVFLSLTISATVNAGQWAVGPIAILDASPYIGGENGVDVFPGIAYEGEKLKIRGPYVDYFVVGGGREDISLALTLGLGANQLEVNGDEQLVGIQDRDSGVLAGVRIDYPIFNGTGSLAVQTDVTDESNGQRAVISWQRPLFNSNPRKWILAARVQAEWSSDDYANFYYGITPQEALASNFDEYTVGNTLQPSIGIQGFYNFSQNWQVIYSMDYQLLSSEVKDSPIVDESGALSGIVGLAYVF